MEKKAPFILLVDDNPTNLDLLVDFLEDEFDLSTATDGQEAVDFAKKWHPDLILLDIEMPLLDGFEVCKALKNDPETEDISIIFISGRTNYEDITNGFRLGGSRLCNQTF